jgi:hypothetical protein
MNLFHSSPFIVNGRILRLYRVLAKGLPTQQVSTTERNLQKKTTYTKYVVKKYFSYQMRVQRREDKQKKIPHHFVNSEGMEYQTIILYRMIRTASAAALALARISSVDSSKEPYANATPMRRY